MSVDKEESTWSHQERVVNGVRLHVVEAGDGTPVILLHGFPDFWYSWRHQIPPLAAAGFRVLAPDMRGYNTSEKPPGVASYHIDALVGDMAGLIESSGSDRAHVVGHDWGGIVAWYLAMQRPELVSRLAVLNAPHPAAFERDLFATDQWKRSWYMAFFQIPRLPELGLSAGNFTAIQRALENETSSAEASSPQVVERYKQAAAQPGALTGGINYYRAAARPSARAAMRDFRNVETPTLLVWGERDRFLGISLTEGLASWVPDIRVERIPAAGHWVHMDEPALVSELLVEFLGQS